MSTPQRRGTRPCGFVAIVLHAHLPYVRHPEASHHPQERWLHEAIWECYLPLISLLRRLDREGAACPLTISVSPPLAAMLSDPWLQGRFEQHLSALRRLNVRQRQTARGEMALAVEHYEQRLQQAAAMWRTIDGRVVDALCRHSTAQLELMTTSASHAYLPGLMHLAGATRAQLRLGQRALSSLTRVRPTGLWLPECAFAHSLDPQIAAAGFGYTVVDAHGLTHAQPRPPVPHRPIVSEAGVAYFARDQLASHQVWSRQHGYPGDPAYRDFYRDLGFELPPDELQPFEVGSMTGLKYWRITGASGAKSPYDPVAARRRAIEHARHFVAQRLESLQATTTAAPAGPPIIVAAYDAELFGHWWFEGPAFLEEVCRLVAHSPGLRATTLAGYLHAHPRLPVALPAGSSWGEGGYGRVWVGPETAPIWRHVHAAQRQVQAAAEANPDLAGVAGRALDQAIRELLLAQASDWAFMIQRPDTAPYGKQRLALHLARVDTLLGIVARRGATPAEQRWLSRLDGPAGYLGTERGPSLRDAIRPGGG